MKLSKKAQMEMIGLVIIVFLLSLGMFFLVSVTNEDNAESKSINPQDLELAQNTIDAIKYIKLDCNGKKIGFDDLIINMAINDENQQIMCNGQSSQHYVNNTVSKILKATLGNWSKAYYFVIIKNEGREGEKEYFSLSSHNCTKNSEGTPGEQPFPIYGGAQEVTMRLRLCS
jgi:hypothetical protein